MRHDPATLAYATRVVSAGLAESEPALDLVEKWCASSEVLPLTLALGAMAAQSLRHYAVVLDVPYDLVLQMGSVGLAAAESGKLRGGAVDMGQRAFARVVASKEDELALMVAPEPTPLELVVLAELARSVVGQIERRTQLDPAHVLALVVADLS